jgi:hypothetical protein
MLIAFENTLYKVTFVHHNPARPYAPKPEDVVSFIGLEVRTSYLSAPLTIEPKGASTKALPHNFDALENRACDVAKDFNIPIVYTQEYLALKNSVIEQEL